jgi:STE24 endopeptidase
MGLLWLAIVAPAATLLVQRLTERIAGREGAPDRRAGPAVLPAAALSLAIVSFGAGIAGNAVSRGVEARADADALRLTRDADAFIAVERKLVTDNLGDPDPPVWLRLLFGTHPPAMDRIGYALRYEREHGRPAPAGRGD